MKIKSSVLFGLIVVIFSVSGFSLLKRLTQDVDEWRPSDLYSTTNVSRRSTYSVVSFGASASYSGAAPSVSSGASSMFRHRGVFSYAPAVSAHNSLANSQYPIGGTSSSSVAPVYTTSSATVKSFGSGNAVSGVSMSGGSLRATNSQSSIANTQSPTANTQLPISNIQSPIASNYQGIGNTTTNGPRAMRGRLSAPTFGDPWWNWLSDWVGETGYTGTGKEGSDGGFDYYFDRYDLQGAYDDFISNYWNSSLGNPPSFNEWLDWFMSSTGNDGYQMGKDTYHWLPVGDVWPLVVMLLFYAGYVFVRKRKQLKVNA